MKRLLAVLITLMLINGCIGLILAEASAPEQHTCEDFLYVILDDGTAEIVGWLGDGREGSMMIPSELDGYPVTAIGDGAFSGRDDLRDIKYLDNITRIGNEAFRDCVNLQVVMPALNLISIGDRAFFGCASLAGFYFNDTVTTIGAEAFSGCSFLGMLGSIKLPDSVTGIGTNAFAGCHMVVVTNPDSFAAQYCEENRIMHTDWAGILSGGQSEPSGQHARVSERINNGEAMYFILADGTVELLRYSVAGDIPEILVIPEEVDGHKVSIISDNAFASRRELVSVTIPDSVIIIGDTAFASCRSLREVVIGNSTTIIGNNAFAMCEHLTAMTIPDSVTCIWPNAFDIRIETAEKSSRGPNPALTLTVSRGSIVEKYCTDNGINYVYSDSND